MMEDVAIFWDYENCPAPSNTSGYALVQSIRSLAQSYGSVKALKAYAGITEQFTAPRTQSLRSEFQSSGVSLIDCPHNGRKDVADKMMLVDMLAHAIDNPSPSTIILISGDRDFAYALSILRLRCYKVVLCTTSNAHLSLVAQASECVEWGNVCAAAVDILAPQWTILNQPTTPKMPTSRLNSQREAPASVPGCKPSREFKEEEGSAPSGHERKRSTTSFLSAYSAFGNPRSVAECIPSSAKQPAPPFKWPNNGGSPKKTFTNIDYSNFQASHTIEMAGKPLASNVITEIPDVSTAISTSPDFTQTVTGSSLQLTQTLMGNNLEDHNPIPNINAGDDDTTSHEPPELQHNSQTPKTPSALPLPDFTLPSNQSSMFTSQLASPFGMSNSNPDHTSSSDGLKPRRFNYSAGVPAHFVILIKVLQAQLKEGKERVLRSQLGEQISHGGLTYQKAGAYNFSNYVAMAHRAGIVELGGSDGKDWIALTSNCRTIYVA